MSTILNVQPRMSGGGGGKSNDEIVYELADNILGKLTSVLDLEQARADMFEVCCVLIGHKFEKFDWLF